MYANLIKVSLSREQQKLLLELAKKYVWWKKLENVLDWPELVASQVMNIGDYEDIQELSRHLGDEYLRHVLKTAQAGQFDKKSWQYWHYRLAMAEFGNVPPLPHREIK